MLIYEKLQASETGMHDYQVKLVYKGVPLKNGWNHFLIKVASDKYWWPKAGTLFVNMESNKKDFEKQLKSAVMME